MHANGSLIKNSTEWSLFLAFLSLTICVLISSFIVSFYEKEHFETEQKEFLINISAHKSDEVANWYKGKINEAKIILNNKSLITGFKKFLYKNGNRVLESKLNRVVDSLTSENGYSCITVLDSSFNVVLKAGNDTCSMNDLQSFRLTSIKEFDIAAEIRKSKTNKMVDVDLLIPIVVKESKSDFKSKGIIVCHINSNQFFESVCSSWFLPGNKIESCLLKRTNDSLLCINEQNCTENDEAKNGLHCLLKKMPAKKIIDNNSLMDYEVDNNGIDVIYYCQVIKGTPLYFLTVTNLNESFGAVRISSVYINSLTLVSLITLGIAFGFYFKVRVKNQGQIEPINSESKTNLEELKHNALFETMFQGVIYTDNNGVIITANPAAEKILGLSLSEIISQSVYDEFWQAVKYDGSKYKQEEIPVMRAIRTGREVKNAIIGIYNPKKKIRCWIIVSAIPQFVEGLNEPYRICTTFEDITERLSYEEQIKNSLTEKEVLLKEIHHRVKNNFQIIISLLNLNEEFLSDKQGLNIFTDIQTRVRSMALIHELMYKHESFVVLNIKDYIENMINFLRNTYIDTQDRINVSCDIDNVELEMDYLIPCGLIINELFTNSLKHAFPNGSRGNISIKFKLKFNKYILSISDDGLGLPKDFDVHVLDTFGLKLVSINTKQLKGEFNINKKVKGVEFEIEFERVSHG
jgi:PAS domain S-box-containing protein